MARMLSVIVGVNAWPSQRFAVMRNIAAAVVAGSVCVGWDAWCGSPGEKCGQARRKLLGRPNTNLGRHMCRDGDKNGGIIVGTKQLGFLFCRYLAQCICQSRCIVCVRTCVVVGQVKSVGRPDESFLVCPCVWLD